MISVVILTKNEEKDISTCLESLEWTDDVHVLDSGSEDRTTEIAARHDASVIFNSFISFGKQRNFALDNIAMKYEWVLFLDADEVVTSPFKNALMESVYKADEQVAGFYCCWKMMLENKWL